MHSARSRISSRGDVSSDSSTPAYARAGFTLKKRRPEAGPGVVVALPTCSIVLGACGDSATVTQEFTGRLARVSEMRDSVEAAA